MMEHNEPRDASRPGDAWASDMAEQDRRVAYEQEAENWRYQDRLWWSRTQTLTVLEVALLVAAYGSTPVDLEARVALAVAILGSLVVAVVTLIAVKDARDAAMFLDRLKTLERAVGLRKATPQRFTLPAGLSLIRAVLRKFDVIFGQEPSQSADGPIEVTGGHLWLAAVALLNVFNGFLIVDLAVRAAT